MARRASPVAKLRHFQVLSRADLGYPGLRVMIALMARARRNGVVEVTQRALAFDLRLDGGTVSRALKRCMEAGWVQKIGDGLFVISRGLVSGDEPDADLGDSGGDDDEAR